MIFSQNLTLPVTVLIDAETNQLLWDKKSEEENDCQEKFLVNNAERTCLKKEKKVVNKKAIEKVNLKLSLNNKTSLSNRLAPDKRSKFKK